MIRCFLTRNTSLALKAHKMRAVAGRQHTSQSRREEFGLSWFWSSRWDELTSWDLRARLLLEWDLCFWLQTGSYNSTKKTQRITTLADQWRIQALFMDITLTVTVAPKDYIANIAAAHTHTHRKRERAERKSGSLFVLVLPGINYQITTLRVCETEIS